MIERIEIRNFATISNTSFDLTEGLNIITGETGAGKSVLVQAISLVLGARADTTFVRTGEDKAIIEIAGVLDGAEVILSREVYASGKSISKINGSLVTLNALNDYCRGFADIHGQYDNQTLLNPDYHIDILDQFNGEMFLQELNNLADSYDAYLSADGEYRNLLKREADINSKKDYYEFELSYIEGLNLKCNEDEELKYEINMLSNSEKIFSAVNSAYSNIHENEHSVLALLKSSLDALETAKEYSTDIKDLSEKLDDIYYGLEDISSELRTFTAGLNYSEAELDTLSERLSAIEDAKRKYNKSIDEILRYSDFLRKELNIVQDLDTEKERLFNLKEESYEALIENAEKVSNIRKETSMILEDKVSKELTDLNFPNSEFKIEFTEVKPSKSGIDSVEFLISTNPGEPLKPLSKIASGGEISRVMLALKGILGSSINVPTMIFDEIDTGISGITASVVGKKLKEISKDRQILCITHLPQIAACGLSNYSIVKESIDNKSHTIIKSLDTEGKIHDIARLLSGSDITATTLKSAEELIQSSN